MSGAALRLQQAINADALTKAIQVADTLDKALDQEKVKAINVLRELKANPKRLEQLQVSDNGYELMPEPPKITRKDNHTA